MVVPVWNSSILEGSGQEVEKLKKITTNTTKHLYLKRDEAGEMVRSVFCKRTWVLSLTPVKEAGFGGSHIYPRAGAETPGYAGQLA